MRDEIVFAMQQMIQGLLPGQVVIGSLPPLNGYAVSFAGGAPIGTFFSLTTDESLPVAFNGKGTDQQEVASSMDMVHKALTTAAALPFTQHWQIYAIETISAPQLIGREENKNWIFGSSFRVKFYSKEGKNG